MITPVLLRLTRRYVQRRWLQSLLFVLGVALGVAVGVAIDLANASASRAFGLSVVSLTGRTTHQVIGSAGVPSDFYRQLRAELGIRNAAPVITSNVRALSHGNRAFQLLGVDPFAEAPFRDYLLPPDTADPALAEAYYRFIVQPGAVLLSAPAAERLGLNVGDRLTLQTRTQPSVEVAIVGLLYPTDNLSQQALANVLIADIATAQELAGQPGQISRIDLILTGDAETARVEAALPPATVLVTPSQQSSALAQMTDAFELNLQALSLLALLVGVFLIYNTVTFSVIQRRPVIGILRSLGSTRRQIFGLILAEALLLGSLGTLIGLGLGVVLGQGAVRLVSQTVNDLYFRVNVTAVTVSGGTLIKGAIVGVAVSLVAAFVPSLEATRTPPAGVMQRSAFEQSARRTLPLLAAGGLGMAALGVVVLRIDTQALWVSFTGLFMILVGAAMLTPLALALLMHAIAPLTGRAFGVLGRMAPRALIRSISRTSVAVAALTLAVSAIVGVGVMIGSFRTTVAEWLDATLGADIFVSAEGGSDSAIALDIDPAIAAELATVPGVARVATVRSVGVVAPDYPTMPPVNLTVPDTDITRRPRRFAWTTAPDGYWNALLEGAVVVSEPFAHRRGITRDNSSITLLTERGPVTFPIVGVYYDYTTDQGTVMMHADIYRLHFDDPYVSALALDLVPEADLASVLDTVRADTLIGSGLEAQSNRELRASALHVFDRTFAITVALRFLATLVAFIGILSALMALQLEHTRQYGVMRANGMTPAQLRIFTFIQTGLMGLTAGILALPIGLALALVLVYVINVRSFGWTMDLKLNVEVLIQAVLVAVGAALVAGIYPAWRLGRMVAVHALRSE